MQAILKTKSGVILAQLPKPKPKANEVLVKVALAGYCRTDQFVAENKIKSPLPLILGHEFSGTIEEVGQKVKKFQPGQRVAVMPVLADNQGHYTKEMLGVHLNGAFAEYVCVPQSAIFKIPGHLSFQKAAYAEPVAASLAVIKAPITKNQTGLVLGENRIAKLTRRIMTVYGFSKTKIVAGPKLKAQKSNSFDYAVETQPTAENFQELVRIIKPGGLIILKSRPHSPIAMPIAEIVKKDLRLTGVYYGHFPEALKILTENKLATKDLFGQTISLSEAVEVIKGKKCYNENKKLFFNPQLKTIS